MPITLSLLPPPSPQELGATASFEVTSLEAKVVVHFGSTLDHYVRIPLNNKYKEQDLVAISDWHSSAAGEETETPEIRDMTGVPQVSKRASSFIIHYDMTDRDD